MEKIEAIKLIENEFQKYAVIDDNNFLAFYYNQDNEVMVEHLRKENEYLETINIFNTGEEIPQMVYQNYQVIDNFVILSSKDAKYRYIYDAKKDQLITSKNVWNMIQTEDYESGLNFYDDYKCFLAKFSLLYAKKIKYKNYFGKDAYYNVNIRDGNYYGFIDFEGNILDNKIYKGDNLAETREIHYLDGRTLLDLKQEKEAKLYKTGENKLEFGINQIKMYGTPYYDIEIMKTLRKKK